MKPLYLSAFLRLFSPLVYRVTEADQTQRALTDL